jgi:hypothetical protein
VSARNIHHDAVVEALKADGWTITDDPLTISYGDTNLFVDLGAERTTLAAEKGARRIAVEVQSFLHPSSVRALPEAVGQYQVYRLVLAGQQPDRTLYMADSQKVYESILADRFGQFVVTGLQVRVVVFDPSRQRVIQWID